MKQPPQYDIHHVAPMPIFICDVSTPHASHLALTKGAVTRLMKGNVSNEWKRQPLVHFFIALCQRPMPPISQKGNVLG